MGQTDPSVVAACGSVVALSLLRRRDVHGRQLPHHHAPCRSLPKRFRFGGNDCAERWFDHRRSIPAALILRFARIIRRAIVGSGTKKPRAIS
jgi:hypothetical protein